MSQLIDSYTGAVRLEKGLILTPGQTPDELVQLIGARPTGSFGKSSWYSDIRMETEFGNFIMALTFKGEALTSFQASILAGYGPASQLVKSKHDEMLTKMLGRPTSEAPIKRKLVDKIFFKSNSQAWHNNTKELVWKLPFGTVTSGIDSREGSAQFQVKWK